MDIEIFTLSAGAEDNEASYNRVMIEELRRIKDEAERDEYLEKIRAGRTGNNVRRNKNSID